MAFLFSCRPCQQLSGVRRDFRTASHMKSHLGSPGTHNMGPLVCSHPGCQRRSSRVDHNNLNHAAGGGTHHAQWVVDPVLARALAAEVERCRLPLAPAPAPAAPIAANPGLGPVGVAAYPVGGQVLAPTPPSREEDEDDDVDYDNRIVEVNGHPLREEVFEILEEVVEELAGRVSHDEILGLKALLIDLRGACAVRDLLTVVKTLHAASGSPEHQRMLVVIRREIKKTFYL